MAKKDDGLKITPIRRIADRIQGTSNSLYKSIYYTNPTNKQNLQSIKTDINKSIKDIMDSNYSNNGEQNISKLIERLLMSQNDENITKEFNSIFGDNEFIANITNSYVDNRWVKIQNDEIDMVLKYMPKLEEALKTIKDNVLSADSFSKDFLNIEDQLEDLTNQEQFSRNIDQLKDSYDLLKLTNEIYYNASKYGEEFIYCVPYQKAIQRLMDRKTANRVVSVKSNLQEGSYIIESDIDGTNKIDVSTTGYSDSEVKNDFSYKFEICDGIIESIVTDAKTARDKLQSVREQSLCEQFFNESTYSVNGNGVPYAYSNNKVMDADLELGNKLPVHHKFDKTVDDDLEFYNGDDTTADGLMTTEKTNNKINDMNGCVVKRLEPERVIPIILDEICLGYYYFEFNNGEDMFDDRHQTTGMVNTINGLRSNGRSESYDAFQRREELLRQVSNQLASRIDTKFINNNQGLKKEIYYLLKYADEFTASAQSEGNIRVSYIPPEDIHHIYFDLDKKTGRGISDLNLSMIPAKLYVAIYITNCLAVMTRGNDKRVYYVKQSVESNISKTLLKTINEIKKSNFGIRQVQSINNVLNIVGRFNDYIIPRGSDGQSPIDVEVIQGQQIEIKTELLNILEESAINVTGVPIEIIQNRQSPDYAIQLTMSNSKFLRFVYARQSEFQKQISRLFTKIYNIEFSNRNVISLTLPPPLFINVTNTTQLVTNTNDYAEQLVNIIASDEQNESVRAKFAKNIKLYFLGTYLNMNVMNRLYDKARQEAIKEEIVNNQEEQ